MYVTTNSALVWKRMADENQQSARLLARICVGLLILLMAAGAYAFSTNSRFNELCTSIEREAWASDSIPTKKFSTQIENAYCS
jgi:hypothetical protein